MRSFLLCLVARDELPSAGSGPEPFGFEPFGLELMAERLMAERLVEGGRFGGRCPFHDVSVGEAAAPLLQRSGGECGGGKPARHCEPLRRGGRDSPVDKA